MMSFYKLGSMGMPVQCGSHVWTVSVHKFWTPLHQYIHGWLLGVNKAFLDHSKATILNNKMLWKPVHYTSVVVAFTYGV